MHRELQNIVSFGENIWRIVLTGGPCSGKTSALAALKSRLTDRGYKVIICPEAATKLIIAGILPGEGELTGDEFQKEILLDTIEQEDRMLSAAKAYRDKGMKVVILCDRGAMDGEAYVGPGAYRALLETYGYTPRQLCDERYHAVMHLRTAALGAEQFYTLANNSARTETPEQARALDARTFEAWQRHPHPRAIDNSTDFDGKMQRLFAEVCVVLGDPVPLEREDKYLVDASSPIAIPSKTSESLITQDYLSSADPLQELRVRSRRDGDGITYYFTQKRSVAPGERVELERMVSRAEYEQLLKGRDPRKSAVSKRRVCFFWGECHFEVDFFESPSQHKGLVLMEVERGASEAAGSIALPPFIKIIRDVTDEKAYSNAELANG